MPDILDLTNGRKGKDILVKYDTIQVKAGALQNLYIPIYWDEGYLQM